jgi:hypothetical protein
MALERLDLVLGVLGAAFGDQHLLPAGGHRLARLHDRVDRGDLVGAGSGQAREVRPEHVLGPVWIVLQLRSDLPGEVTEFILSVLPGGRLGAHDGSFQAD